MSAFSCGVDFKVATLGGGSCLLHRLAATRFCKVHLPHTSRACTFTFGQERSKLKSPSHLLIFRCRLKLSALKSDGIAFDLLLLVSGWVVTLVPIATLLSTLTARLRQPSGLRYQLMHRLHCRWQHIRIRPSSVGVAGLPRSSSLSFPMRDRERSHRLLG